MTTAFEFKNKNILITGASSGIGRACAVLAGNSGARVILNGRDNQRLEETKALMVEGEHQIIAGDLALPETQEQLIKDLPYLDGIVFAAGINKMKPAKFVDSKMLEETIEINFSVPYLLTCGLLKQRKILGGASIVYIGSTAASFAMVGNSVYSASKGALIAAARVLAMEVAKQRIRINVLSPGQVRTPMTERVAAHISPEALAENEAQYPLGFGEPEDVAYAAAFLLSHASRWITGQNIIIDGGYTLK